MLKDTTVRVLPEVALDNGRLALACSKSLGIHPKSINDLRIIRRSVDARKKPVMLNLTVRIATGDDMEVRALQKPFDYRPVDAGAPSAIIVGAGPAGLFAGLECIIQGIRPVILERGRDVDARRIDIANISRVKRINPVSNYCFGEGGAGAYSDGKLYTRSKKRGSVEDVLQALVQHGANPDILIDAHPHIGSDRLPHVIKAIRQTIIRCGGEVHFETMAEQPIMENGVIVGMRSGEKEYRGIGVILATGHSAHDTFRMLHSKGIQMEAKGIAVGVRLEHPQALIDRIQYHSNEGRGKFLPAAEYNFVTQVDGRGVYSFCMCPGGVIVPAGSSDGELVVNGMSASARNGKYANSGMVVEIRPGDFAEYADKGDLEMLSLQEDLERRMYESSGETIIAPAQRMADFTENRESSDLPCSSYAPGIRTADFNKILPRFISDRLRQGFKDFGRKARGFLTNEAILVGLESRTSSPVRMTRDPETLESVNTKGLYPAGEGAGYAGGIVSAAIDGIRCARSLAVSHFHQENNRQ